MLMIDGLQYVNWNRELFEEAQKSGVHTIHVTIAYWENIRETLENIGTWNRHFINHVDLIMPVRQAADILEAKRLGKVGIIFGFQNCSPIEDDVKMVEILHQLGVRIMQLTYNNQSFLATGCYEEQDGGITRFGRQVIKEMNRVGMVIDMSHSAEKSTLGAIEISERPIAITHANPTFFHKALRNKSETVILTHVTSPFLKKETIFDAVNMLNNNKKSKSIHSIKTIQDFVWIKKGSEVSAVNFSNDKVQRTQDISPIFVSKGAFFIAKAGDILDQRKRLPQPVLFFPLDHIQSIEIDNLEDLEFGRLLKG